MTVDSRFERAAGAARGSSIHVQRARKLLWGGAAGGLTATALSLLGFGLGYGTRGLVSAAVAAAMVLFFYGVGQYVMVLFADAGARTLLSVALCSYTARVVVLGLALLLYHKHAESWPLLPTAVFLTTVAVVAGWLLVEVWVFSRLRIAAYDAEYVPPPATGGTP